MWWYHELELERKDRSLIFRAFHTGRKECRTRLNIEKVFPLNVLFCWLFLETFDNFKFISYTSMRKERVDLLTKPQENCCYILMALVGVKVYLWTNWGVCDCLRWPWQWGQAYADVTCTSTTHVHTALCCLCERCPAPNHWACRRSGTGSTALAKGKITALMRDASSYSEDKFSSMHD